MNFVGLDHVITALWKSLWKLQWLPSRASKLYLHFEFMRSENMQENSYVIGLDNTVFSKIAPKFYIFDIKFTKDAKIKAYVAMLEKKTIHQ